MKNNKLFMNVLSILMIIIASLLIPHITQAAESEPTVRILINGEELKTDVPAIVENDRVLVPFRALFEALEINVKWYDSDNSITAETKTKNGSIVKSVYLKIGEKYANLKTFRVEMDVSPVIIDDRTMVPLRFVAEALDMNVNWDEMSRTVKVNNKDFYLDNSGYIVKNQGASSMKSDLAFTDLKDYSIRCNYIVALGENHKIYVVDKSTLKYRVLSNGYSLNDVFYYNNNLYYVDYNDGRNSVMKTDGINEKELINNFYSFQPFRIKNRLYIRLTNTDFKDLAYIDMHTDNLFKIEYSGEYSSILYASENAVFYIDAKRKADSKDNSTGYIMDFHFRIPNKNNSDKDYIIQSISVDSLPSQYMDATIKDDCVYRGLFNVCDDKNFLFYDLESGIWHLNLADKTFKQISDIKAVPMSGYYLNNKFYFISNTQIGFIDLDNNTYSKLFNNSAIFKGCTMISASSNMSPKIIAVDEEGNVTFTIQHQKIQQHYDKYTYKYLFNENKIELVNWNPAIHFDNENPSVPIGTKIDANDVSDT